MEELQRNEKYIIIHRDLKPENILLSEDLDAKLCDFGFAKQIDKNSFSEPEFIGTPYYMSPEQISKLPLNEKTDIWSLGVIIYKMATFLYPFYAKELKHLIIKLKTSTHHEVPRIPNHYSITLYETIQKCLYFNSEERVSVKELFSIPQIFDYYIKKKS